MLAAVFMGKEQVEVKEVDVPELGEEEALVKVRFAGICGTDLHIFAGKHPRVKPPLIMGHEFSGEIAKIKTKRRKDLREGARIVAEPLISCGECFACKSGFAHVCERLGLYGIDADGAFAQYVKVAVDKLFKISSRVDFDIAALIEPVAVAVHAVRISSLKVSDIVCVQGAGPIGLLTALVAKLAGPARVVICENQPFRLKLAEEFGLTAIDVNDKDPVDEISKLTGGRGADIVFEAAGFPATVLLAPRLCRVHGELVIVAMPKEPLPVDILSITFKELTIKGVRVYAAYDFERAIQIIANSGLDFSKLLSEPFALTEIMAGIKAAREAKDVMRVLVKIES
jgi:2-desacetyl-2-hydroxyethyl bacteriochlorophyllide A dehydrogenase